MVNQQFSTVWKSCSLSYNSMCELSYHLLISIAPSQPITTSFNSLFILWYGLLLQNHNYGSDNGNLTFKQLILITLKPFLNTLLLVTTAKPSDTLLTLTVWSDGAAASTIQSFLSSCFPPAPCLTILIQIKKRYCWVITCLKTISQCGKKPYLKSIMFMLFIYLFIYYVIAKYL